MSVIMHTTGQKLRHLVELEELGEWHLGRRLEPVLLVVHEPLGAVNHMESVDHARLIARVRRRTVHDAPCV